MELGDLTELLTKRLTRVMSSYMNGILSASASGSSWMQERRGCMRLEQEPDSDSHARRGIFHTLHDIGLLFI